MSLVAIYPGSFDPVTNGHLDIIRRARRFADHLIVAVLKNSQKQPLFSTDDRIAMLRDATCGWPGIEIDSFEGLLVDYAAQRDAAFIVRGIRAVSDYESELQMAAVNRRLRPETETVFLLSRDEHSYVSSRIVREIISYRGDVSAFVPPEVLHRLAARTPSSR